MHNRCKNGITTRYTSDDKQTGLHAYFVEGEVTVSRYLRVIGVIVVTSAVASGCDNPMNALMAKDATKYVTKVAATVQDRPECQKFKDEIMSYGKGSPYDGKTTTPVVAAKQKANVAGCGK